MPEPIKDLFKKDPVNLHLNIRRAATLRSYAMLLIGAIILTIMGIAIPELGIILLIVAGIMCIVGAFVRLSNGMYN